MTKLSKITYWGMFILSIVSLIISVTSQEYSKAGWIFSTLCWVGVACIKELKYEEKIKELKDYQNGITETKN